MFKDDDTLMNALLKESEHDDLLLKGKTRSRKVKKVSEDEEKPIESSERLRQEKVINPQPEKSTFSKSV